MKDKTAKKVRTHRFEEWALKVAALLGRDGNVTEGIHTALAATPIIFRAIFFLRQSAAQNPEAARLASDLSYYYWHLREIDPNDLNAIEITDRHGKKIYWGNQSPQAVTEELAEKQLLGEIAQDIANKHRSVLSEKEAMVAEQLAIASAAIEKAMGGAKR
jgi:hypothetical protein